MKSLTQILQRACTDREQAWALATLVERTAPRIGNPARDC